MHVCQVDTIETSLELFNETSPLHITLTLDLKQYQREKYKGKYMPVHFRYELNDTTYLEKDLRLKARGEFRRSHCNLAPIEYIDQYREDILQLVREFPYLDQREIKELIRYLENNFDLATYPNALIQSLESSCIQK